MFNWIIRKIIGTKNQRTVRRLTPTVTEINRIEAQLQNEPEEALRERTQKWQAQFRAFHTPPFLGGVGLRIADEATVDACLEQVEQYFAALKKHFPSLEDDYIAPRAAGARRVLTRRSSTSTAPARHGTRSSRTSMPSSRRCSMTSFQKCMPW